MSSVDLNIIERGLKGQAWTAEKGSITSADIAKISEQRTDNSSALNALPTPFARFFVVKEAFRRILEEEKDSNKNAGQAYHHLVSDTLDVFELLYNITFHKNRWGNSRKIVVREWNLNCNLTILKKQVPILGDAVEDYFSADFKASGNRLFFVVLEDDGRDYLLATSSPFTGFVTPPDLDKKIEQNVNGSPFIGKRYDQMPKLVRTYKGEYFRDILPFKDRSKDFKNYMFYIINNCQLGNEMKELRDYIKQIQITDPDINNNWSPQLEVVNSENANNLIINGLSIYKDSSINAINFFNDTLIRLPFRLSKDYYQPMTYIGADDNRDYDFILPISRKALPLIKGNFQCDCKVTKAKVVITLKYNGQEYSKDYYVNSDTFGTKGHIVDLRRENISFDLAVFPNILSPNKSENNYFKVMAALSDSTENHPITIANLDMTFFVKNDDGCFQKIETIDKDNTHALFGVRPAVVRSQQNRVREIDAGSMFYEVFNSQFDAINLRFTLNDGICEGLLLLNWKCAQLTQDAFTYAIDLGTTNTYISCRKSGVDNEPEQLNMDEPMVAFLNDFKRSPQHSLVSVIENGIAPKCRRNFNTEFVPALIDGSTYRFPIRSALCVQRGNSSKLSLFDNCNIAFFYEKSMGLGNQTILTDIKWEDSYGKELRIFIRELLLIIKTSVLQKNGQLSSLRLIWFRPLSFNGTTKELYNAIWQEEAKEMFNIGVSQIECVSESEAPYYYFSKKNSFNSVDAVSIVDIGGGSSDFVYFADGKPQIANSVHFGCDVLWGNGFSGFDNIRDNGIYKRFVETIHFDGHNDDLQSINKKMLEDKEVTTKDIINFWISNDKRSGISMKLKQVYKPLFLYHFASIVYFMAKMYKVKELSCPRSVLFCGNGSRYIDGLLSTDKGIIQELVSSIFKNIYGENIKDIQVILPNGRKECTCYGGLYRASDAAVPCEFNFHGVSDKVYENVEQLKTDFSAVSHDLLNTMQTFNELYMKLLKFLISKGEIDNQIDLKDICKIISSDLQDSIEKNFKTQVIQKHNDNEVYHDSVFFLPIIDNILKLTKI